MSDENESAEVKAPFSLTTPIFEQIVYVMDRLAPAIQQQLGEDIGYRIQQQNKHSERELAGLIQFIITTLINKLGSMSKALHMDVNKKDYQTLETAVQKAEAEIRNHIRIEQQLKIYLDNLEEKVSHLEIKLKQTEQANMTYEANEKKYEAEQKSLLNKVRRYEEKMYEASRQVKWESCDKRSYEHLLNKGSLNLREKPQPQPYLFNDSKSKHLINRIKGRSKNLKGSIIIAFQNMGYGKQESSEDHLQVKKKRGNGKISSVQSYKQLNCSGQITDLKRRRKQFTKYHTEAGKKEVNSTLHVI